MKENILKHAKRMMILKERLSQKPESLLKLDPSNGNEESYIPGSLQRKNPIVVPGYYNDNKVLNEIAKEG